MLTFRRPLGVRTKHFAWWTHILTVHKAIASFEKKCRNIPRLIYNQVSYSCYIRQTKSVVGNSNPVYTYVHIRFVIINSLLLLPLTFSPHSHGSLNLPGLKFTNLAYEPWNFTLSFKTTVFGSHLLLSTIFAFFYWLSLLRKPSKRQLIQISAPFSWLIFWTILCQNLPWCENKQIVWVHTQPYIT